MAMTSVGITPDYEKQAEGFYKEILKILIEAKLAFLIAGTYAVKFYTGIERPTKDMDVFTPAKEYQRILKVFADLGHKVVIEDERWLARVFNKHHFVDIIFGSIPGIWPITEQWIERAQPGEVLGYTVPLPSPEDLIISKIFRMRRDAFDGADVCNVILKQADTLDWHYLLDRMGSYWEVLLAQIILFRFVYPSERERVPRFVMEELLKRVKMQMELPTPKDKVCRGGILSWEDYKDAIQKWGFKDITQYTF